MSTPDEYTQDEIIKMIQAWGLELRNNEITEKEFRIRVARLKFNAVEIDTFVNEALKPT